MVFDRVTKGTLYMMPLQSNTWLVQINHDFERKSRQKTFFSTSSLAKSQPSDLKSVNLRSLANISLLENADSRTFKLAKEITDGLVFCIKTTAKRILESMKRRGCRILSNLTQKETIPRPKTRLSIGSIRFHTILAQETRKEIKPKNDKEKFIIQILRL